MRAQQVFPPPQIQAAWVMTPAFFNAAGQVLQERRAVGTPLEEAYATFTYSLNGQQITEADARNNLTCFDFDGYDRAWRTRYPLTGTGAGACDSANAESFTLDANGNHLADTRRDGQVISLAYDALNRPTVKSSPGAKSDQNRVGFCSYLFEY